ncbi:MAG TPA: UDP-N-acetylmuramate dehydrogenase [Pseudomonadales bacterium]|nr:UDP-N-acetylmuramate dehydrogenase [Pseudomonadales bacterium]
MSSRSQDRETAAGRLDWHEDVDLGTRNSLRLPSRCRYFARARSSAAAVAALERAAQLQVPAWVLGQGSNVVLPPRVEGLILTLDSEGLERAPSGDAVDVRIDAGRDWHRTVLELCAEGLWGIENLALIPGSLGAAPVQNIGAYGQEFADSCTAVTAIDRRSGDLHVLSAADCGFAYRDSRFRRALDRWLILSVELRLRRDGEARIDYPGVAEALAGTPRPTPTDVARAVSAIRRERLPDPAFEPNAGSFFKNPVISRAQHEALRLDFPDLPGHALAEQLEGDPAPAGGGPGTVERVKIPAAWLIDRCGWRGQRMGGVGVAERHALVLVHHGGADGRDLLALAGRIRDSVRSRFGITLEQEPVLLGWASAGDGLVAAD